MGHDNGIDGYAYGHYKVQSTYQLVQPDSLRTRIMHFDGGNECEDVSSSDIARPENLSERI